MIRDGSIRQQFKSVTAEDIKHLPVVTGKVRDALVRLAQQIAELPEVERRKMEFVLSSKLFHVVTELNTLCGFNRYEPAIDAALRNDDMDGFIAALDGIIAHSIPHHRSQTRPS